MKSIVKEAHEPNHGYSTQASTILSIRNETAFLGFDNRSSRLSTTMQKYDCYLKNQYLNLALLPNLPNEFLLFSLKQSCLYLVAFCAEMILPVFPSSPSLARFDGSFMDFH